MSYKDIFGLSVSEKDIIKLSNGDLIILADYGFPPNWYKGGKIDFCNHNIFRLDKEGKVVWQVQRDEQGKLNWESAHRHAQEEGKEGYRDPFGELHLLNTQDEIIKTDTWTPGLKLRALAEGIYEIDIETGIAKNVTPSPWRAW